MHELRGLRVRLGVPGRRDCQKPKGPVTYDAERCIGCRYCLAACPFNIPKFEWDSPNPRIRKCDMCGDRVEAGLRPACVEACRVGALKFGSRQELIAAAFVVYIAAVKLLPVLPPVPHERMAQLADTHFLNRRTGLNLPEQELTISLQRN